MHVPRIVCVVGARPNFIKSAPLFKVLKRRAGDVTSFLVHTGQHYDDEMSKIFFDELKLPAPDVHLGVGSGTHAQQTGAVLIECERVFQREQPDWVLVFGDVNSTLGAALAAAKLCLPIAHVEAGLRSFNRRMPEEINRVLTDHLSGLLFCPTKTAVKNLAAEGIHQGVHLVGDVMLDALLEHAELARQRSDVLTRLRLAPRAYGLATIHRADNTDDPSRLAAILRALTDSGEPLLLPLHPRTEQRLAQLAAPPRGSSLRFIDPVSYLDMLMLEQHARMIVTDSGGVQKEAMFFKVPCVTLREETEWVETVESGWNELVGADPERLQGAIRRLREHGYRPQPARQAGAVDPVRLFGGGRASEQIVEILLGCPS